jgi:penicillin-binding protein 1A
MMRRGGKRIKGRGGKRRRMPVWRYAFLVSAGLMIVTMAAGAGLFMGYVRTLPPIDKLEYYDPPEVTRVSDRSGQETIGEFKKEKRYVTPIEQIPRPLQQAFLAIEDSRFYRHFGVDVIGVLRAVTVMLKSGKATQGASTITQQLTRNILPEEVGFERTLSRKIKEAILALQIERRYSKDQILEFYLNHIEFLFSSFGVKAAAATYFSKDLKDLTLAECATLAAMPANPIKYNPIRNPKASRERRDLVLRRMLELEMISREEYDEAAVEPLVTRRGYGAPSLYPYFLDALNKDLKRRYGLSDLQLRQGGYRISATVDSAMQQICATALKDGLEQVERQWQAAKLARHYEETKGWDGVVRSGNTYLMKIAAAEEGRVRVRLEGYEGTVELPAELPYYNPREILKEGRWLDIKVDSVQRSTITGRIADDRPVQGAVVVLDAHTGEVLALVGGSNFYASPGGSWNLAIQGGRQPGSCLKPFFYAAAMERRGIGPNSLIIDEPVEYGTLDRPYRPINYEKSFERRPITMTEALEHSRNVVTIRLFEAMGLKSALDDVRRFDFSQEQTRWSLPQEISTCLGTIDTTPLEVAAAYQALANYGVGARPEYLRTILGKDGQVAFPVKQWEEAVLDPIAAYQTVYMMRQVVLTGTGQTAIGSRFPSPPYPPICGKTGTTTDNRDAWFAGFTPDLAIVVQVGFDPPRPLGPKLTGGRVAGPIWAEVFRGIHKTRRDWTMAFDMPAGITPLDVCGETGKEAGEVCRRYDHRIFEKMPLRTDRTPLPVCDGLTLPLLIAPVGPEFEEFARGATKVGFARFPTEMPAEEELESMPLLGF